MDLKKLIGNRIKNLRRRNGYSQEKLAEVIGINCKYLSGIERDEENPTLDLFIRLSQGLRVNMYEIFQIEQKENKPSSYAEGLKLCNFFLVIGILQWSGVYQNSGRKKSGLTDTGHQMLTGIWNC